MVTEADSWVALAAIDSAVYGVQQRVKRPMQRVKSTCVAIVGWASVVQRFTKCGLLGQVAREELRGPCLLFNTRHGVPNNGKQSSYLSLTHRLAVLLGSAK